MLLRSKQEMFAVSVFSAMSDATKIHGQITGEGEVVGRRGGKGSSTFQVNSSMLYHYSNDVILFISIVWSPYSLITYNQHALLTVMIKLMWG